MQVTEEILAKIQEIANTRKAYYQAETELENLMELPEMTLSDIRFDSFMDAEYGDHEEIDLDAAQEICDFITENSAVDD